MNRVLLDHGLDDRAPAGGAMLYRDPLEIVRADDPAAVAPALARLDAATAAGLTAAGFLSYELGYCLEPRLLPLLPAGRPVPLLWFGLFRAGEAIADVDAWLAAQAPVAGRLAAAGTSIDRDGYRRRFTQVQDFIAAGDVYQINLTFTQSLTFTGDPVAIYRQLRRRQPVATGALIGFDDRLILSLSPELFIATGDGRITARPMKGTAPRGPTADLDAEHARRLAEDAKSRAENLMIVDLIRNDLGRISETGSVTVPDLYTIETLPTVHQMTSGITARLRPDTTPAGLVRALFPSGSVTGAPKIRAMEIIRGLEGRPRGVYTGAIGRFGPGMRAALNVAIRTLVLTPDPTATGGRGELGVGSGLVFDSDGDAEYDECRLKARFLAPPDRDFRLVETLRWQHPGGYPRRDRHLARLARSAAWFGFACDPAAVGEALATAAAAFSGDRRVRLLLAADGSTAIESTALEPQPGPAGGRLRATLRPQPRRLDDPFLYHKTTRRQPYDAALAEARTATGCDEVIFVNDRGELTEGSWTNLFVERQGRLLTPPVSCGLLAGTLRQELLDDQPGRVGEQMLYPADLRTADRVWLGNSVRGLIATEIV